MVKTAVLGFGNPSRADDGIGVEVVHQLKQKLNNQSHDHVEVIDMGTSAFEMLYKLKEFDRMILVDGVIHSNEEVGTVFQLPEEAINTEPNKDLLVFLHGLKWDQAITYARNMLPEEEFPKQIDVFLIAIENTSFNTDISEEVKKGGLRCVNQILNQL